MNAAFADTFFFLALLSSKDEAHEEAVRFYDGKTEPMITTEWVLIELADGLCRVGQRQKVESFVRSLRRNPRMIILPVRDVDFDRGLALYAARPDKNWSLTDCISFNTMEELHLKRALTGDHHFEQAGFTILFP